MTGLGTLLQEARKKQGLTIEDIAEKTKLRPQFIQAMEQGDFQELPDEAYVRPFLRTYAKALGLDADALLYELDAHALPVNEELSALQERRAQLKTQRRRRFWLRSSLIVVVLAGFGYALYRLIFS